MTLGSSLAHYRILSKLGEGGMGAVYRATDTKLNRDVAIKVLPDSFAQDPGRLARFTRESQILAALNHPNIASVYGVEERALVMELVDGVTLAERIAAGAIPAEEAVPIARQIAEGLEYAHDRGVVHRDLKPANIKITPEGVVKILDFGLAKAMEEGDGTEKVEALNSPTLSMRATQMGLILGTASYMSPEQAAGKPVDKRADIWSFGVVLWEMLSGQMLFKGESVPHTLADVLRRDIELNGLPAETPRAIRELVGRCLDRDLKQRLRDIGEARIALQRWQAAPKEAEPATPAKPRRSIGWIPWAVACAVLAAVSLWLWTHSSAPDTAEARFAVDAPAGFSFRSIYSDVAISPDGRYLVFSVMPNNLLWVRPIDSLNARPLPGTDRGTLPFWSPDSQSLAFFADGKLKRIALAGGAPVVLCDADTRPGGGTWNRDGVILIGGTGGLHRISAGGGMSAVVTKLDAERTEAGHIFPQFLPDGRRFLYYVGSSDENIRGTYAASLDRPTERSRILGADFKSIYVPARGNRKAALLWLRDQTLLAQSFDAKSAKLSGEPVPIAEGIATSSSGAVRASFFVSDAGVLAFHSGPSAGRLRIIWRDRRGKELEEAAKEDSYTGFRLSPDGKRVLVGKNESTKSDFWVFDLGRPVMTRLTFDGAASRRAAGTGIWSPDGRSVAFSLNRNGVAQLCRTNTTGTGQEEQLTDGPGAKEPTDWSRDGRYLIFNSFVQPPFDVRALSLDEKDPAGSGRRSVIAVQSRKNAGSARLSPDGKWIAYDSDESGRYEAYVQPFAPAGAQNPGKWQISDHGIRPRWSPDGKEILYFAEDRVMAATVSTKGGEFRSETPHELFRSSLLAAAYSAFDISPDGKRFLTFAPPNDASSTSLTVVVNWQAALR